MLFWKSGITGRYLIIRIKDLEGDSFAYMDPEHEWAAESTDELIYYVHPSGPHPFDAPAFVDTNAEKVYVGWSKIQLVLAPKRTYDPPKSILPPKIMLPPKITDDTDLCVICLDRARTHAMYPCGHKCLCELCSTASIKQCPLCRAVVQSSLKIFN